MISLMDFSKFSLILTATSFSILTFFSNATQAHSRDCKVTAADIQKFDKGVSQDQKKEALQTLNSVSLCLMNNQILEPRVADFALTLFVESFETNVRLLHFELRQAEQAFLQDLITITELQRIRALKLAEYEKEQAELNTVRDLIQALRIR